MTGVNGDYYLNVVTGDVFQKLSGTWTLIGNIKGPPFTPSTSKVRAYGNSKQILNSDGTPSKIILNHTEFDILNEFDTTLYRFVPSQAGYYLITANLGISVSTVVSSAIYIYKNGSVHSMSYIPTAYPHLSITDLLYLNIGDYVEMWGASGDGTKGYTPISGTFSLWMAIFRII
jgi:hypothetical protein